MLNKAYKQHELMIFSSNQFFAIARHGLLLWDRSPIRLVYGVKYSVNSESLEVYELGVHENGIGHSFIDCQLVPKQPAELFQIFNDGGTFVIQFL